MYQALYRKWRPLKFVDVIGQRHITDTLRSQLTSGRLSHAYLFTGTRGTGKTTCAKILARAVNCEAPINGDPCNECPSCRGILDGSVLDVLEIDAASNNGVDNIRDIRDESQYTPAMVKRRVYIIDEVHMLSQGAFNALLKTLEEPPKHVMFILATTEIHKVPATILSRCQRFDFRRITSDDIANSVKQIAEAENINITEDGAKLIARLSDGAMRDALSMLDRTAAGGVEVTQQSVSNSVGILGYESTTQLMEYICKGMLSDAVMLVGECYELGRDLSAVLDQLLGLIRDILLVKTAKTDVSNMISVSYDIETVKNIANISVSSTFIAYTKIIEECISRMKNASNRRVEAELCVIRLCSLKSDDYDSFDGRLQAVEQKIKDGISVNYIQNSNAQPINQEKNEEIDDVSIDAKEEKTEEKQQAKQKSNQIKVWKQWPTLIKALAGKISSGAHVNLKLSAVATLEGNTLTILADDAVTAMLADVAATKEIIAHEVSNLVGQNCIVKVREMENIKDNQTLEEDDELQDLIDHAQQFDIEIKEIN